MVARCYNSAWFRWTRTHTRVRAGSVPGKLILIGAKIIAEDGSQSSARFVKSPHGDPLPMSEFTQPTVAAVSFCLGGGSVNPKMGTDRFRSRNGPQQF